MSGEISQGLSGTDGDTSPVGDSNSSELSESPELTFGELPELPEDNDQTADTATGNTKGHPAWDEYLKDIPEQFRSQVTPAFEKWDKDFQKVQSRYAPYEKFTQHDPAELDAAMQVTQLLRTNPKALYDNLAERFGFNANVDQGQSEEEDDPYSFEDDEDEDDSIENNPQFREMAEKFQQMQEFIQNQQRQQQAAQMEAQVQQETNQAFNQIEKAIGRSLSQQEKTEVIKRAVLNGDSTGNYDIIEGYKDFARLANSIRNQPRKNASAPAVLSGNGGLPVKSTEDQSLDEKFAGFAAQIAAGNQ